MKFVIFTRKDKIGGHKLPAGKYICVERSYLFLSLEEMSTKISPFLFRAKVYFKDLSFLFTAFKDFKVCSSVGIKGLSAMHMYSRLRSRLHCGIFIHSSCTLKTIFRSSLFVCLFFLKYVNRRGLKL